MSGTRRVRRKTRAPSAGIAVRRAKILDAARALFLRDGYAAVSMDAVAGEAEVSKQTLYNHFASKQELFDAMVRGRCAEMIAVLQAPAVADASPRQVLRELGQRVIEKIFTGNALLLFRTVVAEVPRLPELGERYYKSGPVPAIAALAAYLAEQKRRHKLAIDDPVLAAEQFYALIGGHLRTRALLGVEQRPTAATVKRHIDAAVDTFLKAFAPR